MPRRTSPHATSTNVSIARVCQAVLQRSQNVPICEDVDKRLSVYDYLCSVRYRLLRILMIIQWVSRSKAPLEQLTLLNDYIDEKNRTYRRYAHRLCIQAAQLEQNLYPAWDVETAMHLLCHGRYPWFCIQSRRSPSRRELLARLDSLIHCELACNHLTQELCLAERKIAKGRLYLTMGNDIFMSLTLKIHNEERLHRLYWYVLCLRYKGRPRDAALEQECNRLLFEHASSENALSFLSSYLRRYSDKERFRSLQQDAASLSDKHAYINIKVLPGSLIMDINYWQLEKSFLPVKGHISNDEKTQSNSAVIRISLDPPVVQHIPYFAGATAAISLSMPLSQIVQTIIDRRVVYRIKELFLMLQASSSDMICWDSVVVQDNVLRVYLFGRGKFVTFPDGFLVEITINSDSGAFQLSSPYSDRSHFWRRLLSKLALHLNSSISKMYQVLLAVCLNALIEHFVLLASISGFDALRTGSSAELHSACIRIPRFSSQGLLIELGQHAVEFKLCHDIHAARAPEIIEQLSLRSLIAESSSAVSLPSRSDSNDRYPLFSQYLKDIAEITPVKFRSVIQSCQNRIILRYLVCNIEPQQYVFCKSSLVCLKVDKYRDMNCPSPLYVLLSARNGDFWTAIFDCSGLKGFYTAALPYFNETPGFIVDSVRKIMEISYPIETVSSLQSNAFAQCRTDLLTFLQMAHLVTQYLSLKALSDDDDKFKPFRYFELTALFHKKAYFKTPTGLTVVIATYVINDNFYYSLQFLPRAFPHRQYLEHLLNSNTDGLLQLFTVLYESEDLVNATIDFVQSVEVIDYIAPDLDIVPESANWLRVVYRSGKLSVHSWVDLLYLPDKSARVELVPRSEDPVRCNDRQQLLQVLSDWKAKCFSFAEYTGVHELLRRKESNNDVSQWCDNGVEFKIVAEDRSFIGIGIPNPEYSTVQQYAAVSAVGSRLTGLARICYSPPVSFQQSISIFKAIQLQSPGLLRCELMLQCKLPWAYSHATQILALCIAFGDMETGSCVLRLQMAMNTHRIALYGKDSDTILLNQYLEDWDKSSFGSAILLLRRRSLLELAMLRNK